MKDSLKVLAIIAGVFVFVGLYLVYINYISQYKVLSCNDKTAIKLLKETIRDPKNYSEVSDWGIDPSQPLDINNIIEYKDPDKKIRKSYCEANVQDQNIYYTLYNQNDNVSISVSIISQ